MKWFLVAYILTDGHWVHGDKFDGWGPMEQPSEELCAVARDRANKINNPDLIVFSCEQLSE